MQAPFASGKRMHILYGVAISVVCALLSSLKTGFQFGINNNIFHIPYVLRLNELPEFANDAFYQSLKNFTSAVWPLLRLVATEENIRLVFQASFFLGRLAAFFAIYIFANSFYGKSKKLFPISLFMVAVAVNPWLVGASVVGSHGLFIEYFTHTEVTWPFVILALVFFERRNYAVTGFLSGCAFAINAFVGIWLIWIFGITAIVSKMPVNFRNVLASSAGFFLAAVPVVVWIAVAITNSDASTSFSFREYIRLYYSAHFLIESANLNMLVKLALFYVAGLAAAFHLRNRRYWLSFQISLLALFIVGVALPYLIDSRFVFNLHLLRSDGIEQALSVLLISITAVQLLFGNSKNDSALGVFVLMLGISSVGQNVDLGFIALLLTASALKKYVISDAVPYPAITLRLAQLVGSKYFLTSMIGAWFVASLVVHGFSLTLLTRFIVLTFFCTPIKFGVTNSVRFPYVVRAATIAVGFSVMTIFLQFSSRIKPEEVMTSQENNWNDLTAWVRHSDIHGQFLVKPGNVGDNFQLMARRPVWVDWKQGAAVMWKPSFYNTWGARYKEVRALNGPEQYFNYARLNHIGNVIIESGEVGCPSDSEIVKRFGEYVYCKLPTDG